jgi:hypothetical protein
VYEHDPYLLREFTPEAVQVLLWAAGKHALSKDIAMQVAHVLTGTNGFDERVWRIALEAYAVLPTQPKGGMEGISFPFSREKFLPELVSYLLRNQKYEEQYLSWYRQGIEEELRLSGIYEAYMMTLPDYSPEALPNMLLLYFQYSCNLPDQKKALLYANVITHREQTPGLYQQYLRQIEEFAGRQMMQGHINDNLAIIYQNILQVGVVGEDLAQAAAGMVYMRKIVTLHPDVTRIFLYQEQYEMPIVVPVVQHQAYVPIVSKHYRMFLETKRGEMLCDSSLYAMQRMLYADGYISKLKQLAPGAMPFVLTDLEQKETAADFGLPDIPKIQTLLQSSLVSKRYIVSKYPVFVTFLQEH